MTAADDITKGTSAFNYAIRHPHKSGSAFTVMPRRSVKSAALAVVPSLIGAGLFLLAVGVVVGVVR